MPLAPMTATVTRKRVPSSVTTKRRSQTKQTPNTMNLATNRAGGAHTGIVITCDLRTANSRRVSLTLLPCQSGAGVRYSIDATSRVNCSIAPTSAAVSKTTSIGAATASSQDVSMVRYSPWNKSWLALKGFAMQSRYPTPHSQPARQILICAPLPSGLMSMAWRTCSSRQ